MVYQKSPYIIAKRVSCFGIALFLYSIMCVLCTGVELLGGVCFVTNIAIKTLANKINCLIEGESHGKR